MCLGLPSREEAVVVMSSLYKVETVGRKRVGHVARIAHIMRVVNRSTVRSCCEIEG